MSRSETFRPLYKTLVDKIELDIIRRNLKTGDFFCVLKDLCDQYQVSIITVRKAVSILEHNGILSCKSASGIYIANRELLNTLNTFERIILIPHRGITASKRRISETDVDQSATRHRSISSSLPVPV